MKINFAALEKSLISLLTLFFVSFSVSAQSLYFEKPVPLTEKNTCFPVVVKGQNKNYLFYEEIRSGSLYVDLKIKEDDWEEWSPAKTVAGPFSYSGEVPDIFTAAVLEKGIISVAVTLSEYEIGIYTSLDQGQTFTSEKLVMKGERIVAPRIFRTKNDGFVLFVSLGTENKFSIAWTVSSNGKSWSSITPFAPAMELDNSFSPYLCPLPQGDMIVFQSHFSVPERPKTFQLYTTLSTDNLKSFSPAVLFTDDSVTSSRRVNSFVDYSNQSPVLFAENGSLWCAWERNEARSENIYISLAQLDITGKITGRGRVKEFSDLRSSHRPSFFSFEKSLYLMWFDNNNGAYYSRKSSDNIFSSERLIKNSTKATFPHPVISSDSKIAYLWQLKEGASRIYAVNQDLTAPPPRLSAVSFKENKRAVSSNVKIKITIPEDTNGISGYVWSFSKDKFSEPSTDAQNIIVENNISSGRSYVINANAAEDGEYYFKAKVLDVAGNWSESALITYYRDLTPPHKPSVFEFLKDEAGFVKDSMLSLRWQKDSQDDDVAGYSWTFTKVQELDSKFKDSPQHPLKASKEDVEKYVSSIEAQKNSIIVKASKPPQSVLTVQDSKQFINMKNGVYVFSVCAVDEVGNVGPAESEVVLINKYRPFTLVSGLQTKKNDYGALNISVFGQDFNYEGYIDQIYIDRDGKAPYDRTLYYSKGDYKIDSSGKISQIRVDELDTGRYGIYLHHTERGISPSNTGLSSNKFIVDESGSIKIEHPYVLSPEWKAVTQGRRTVQIIDLLLAVLFILCIAAAVFSLRGMAHIARESVLIQSEVTALLTGGVMPLSKKIKVEKLKKRQTSLKLKLTGFTVLLVLAIVTMVSVSLGRRMVKTQRQTLVQSMQEQVVVLLEGMANSVQNAMNDAVEGGSTVGLIDLVRQADTFKPSLYATLIGRGLNKGVAGFDYFWASTETTASVASKLDTDEPSAGKSRFNPDTIEARIAGECSGLEQTAHEAVDSILEEISKKYSKEKKDEYTALLNSLSRNATQAVPQFTEDTLGSEGLIYTFYYPVFYKNSSDNNLLHAVLVLQVSAEELMVSLNRARMTIIVIALIVAAIALALGVIGSWVLASLIVEPIKKLVNHVKVITDTKDKKKLKDFSISINTRDEIGTLGQAVNEMTDGLVKAAEDEEKAMEQEKMALDGKAVQQTFLPLLTTDKGGKKTTAELKEKDFHIFGYYEGADAVSGDYFDYKKLDDRFYAVIKCDVSGHGVPAALIMTVVATLFRKYFETWTYKTHGYSLDKLVVQINDFIESLGVKGKFATLMICLFDTKTGDVHMCNAGDNIIHVFDQKSRQEKVITLHEAPAAGPLPSFMVEMKGGFIVEKTHLNPGDVLFLYTDGIEEATRFFRNSDFEITKCTEPGLKEDDIHINHKVGQESEQMESDRVKDILEAVLNRQKYQLVKHHNPLGTEDLTFDFTSLEGNVSEAIMALAAVEKIFRIYKTPSASGSVSRNEAGDVVIEGDAVRVDRRIDQFLKMTFNRYDYYCSGLADLEEPNYVYYTGVNEDPQADDLTLLAIRKL